MSLLLNKNTAPRKFQGEGTTVRGVTSHSYLDATSDIALDAAEPTSEVAFDADSTAYVALVAAVPIASICLFGCHGGLEGP